MSPSAQDALLHAMEWTEVTPWYKGEGRAEMEDPHVVLSGDASVHLDHGGAIFIDLNPQSVRPEPPAEQSLFELLATRPDPDNVRRRFIGLQWPSCPRLTISTSDGVFRTTNARVTRIPFGAGQDPLSEPFPFRALRGEFVSGNSKPPRYWLVPLSNFVGEFFHESPDLFSHPLRYFDGSRRLRIIPFEFQGRPGFIQPLPDHEELLRRLHTGRACSLVTAFMVGEVGANPTDMAGLGSWFPFDLLPLIGMVSGQEVGAPWVEFRADDGSLSSRVHIPYSGRSYSPGRPAIRESICASTGALLTNAIKSGEFGQAHLRVAINHVVRANRGDRTIDGKLNTLCIALETLMKHHGIKSENLLEALDLPLKAAVQDILKDAASRIVGLAKTATPPSNPVIEDILGRISRRVPSAAVQEEKFGHGVLKLINKFGLKDAEVLGTHFRNRSLPKFRDWPEMLSRYRGTVAHEGYVKVSEAPHVLDEVANLGHHLHDILIRVLLKTLGYQGCYQPATIPAVDRESLDWVTPATQVRDLGYV